MKTSKELKEQLAQIKKDAAESVCEILGERESVKIDVELAEDRYATKVYRENGNVFVEVRESEPYEYYPGADEHGMVTSKYRIDRFGTFEIFSILEGLESA